MNVKPVMFPPGYAKLETKPGSTGSLTAAIMMEWSCRPLQRPDDRRRLADDHVGRERHQFCCVSPYAGGVGPTKRYSIWTLRPSIHPNS